MSSAPSSSPHTHPHSRRGRLTRLVRGLRWLWVLVVLYAEYGAFRIDVDKCQWPVGNGGEDTWSPWLAAGHRPFHVLLVADPQIIDPQLSYPTRPYFLGKLTQLITNQYLRKSWKLLLARRPPDAVLFLGDLMDAGVALDDEAFSATLATFRTIFPAPLSNAQLPIHYLPGNHDLPCRTQSNRTHIRFAQNIGPIEYVTELGNHTIVAVDSLGIAEAGREWEEEQTLSGMRWRGVDEWLASGKRSRALEFVEGVENINPSLPRLLLSHIPFQRPSQSSCGPLREHNRGILQGFGKGYQNLLDKDMSEWVLTRVGPVAVFSGDDHDTCVHIHRLRDRSIPETTVRPMSMVMNVRRPGYALVSLLNPASTGNGAGSSSSWSYDTLRMTTCFLPDQIRLYLHLYLPLFALSVATILLVHLRAYVSEWRGRAAQDGEGAVEGEDESVDEEALLGGRGTKKGVYVSAGEGGDKGKLRDGWLGMRSRGANGNAMDSGSPPDRAPESGSHDNADGGGGDPDGKSHGHSDQGRRQQQQPLLGFSSTDFGRRARSRIALGHFGKVVAVSVVRAAWVPVIVYLGVWWTFA